MTELARTLAAFDNGELLRRFDELDSAVRQAGLSVSEIERCFHNVTGILESEHDGPAAIRSAAIC